jgi:hypothetical protein
MKEAVAVMAGVVATIVIFTVLSGGRLGLGTSPTGPYLNFAFQGPKGP